MFVVINLIAVAGIAAIALYGAVLLWRNLVETRMALASHRLELAMLEQQIADLGQQQQLQRARLTGAWEGVRKFELRGKVLEADGICSFYFAPHDGKPLPAYHPGQYLTLQLNLPDQPKPVIRCYSLSDSPTHPDHYRITVKRIPAPPGRSEVPDGIGSTFLHHHLNPDDIIDIKAPAGHFYLDLAHHHPVVLIGGGIGVTPVLSMLNAIVASGSTREVWFFYGVRNGREVIMRDHFQDIANANPNVHLHICFSEPAEEDVQGLDYHHDARVSVALFKELLPSNNYDFYICGPPPMMDSLTSDLYDWGVPKSKVHFEAFGPASVKKVTSPETQPAADAAAFTINLKRSAKQVAWTNGSGSILECAEAAGATLESGCRAGNCGACEVAVIEGEVDYLNEPGAAVEEGSCLACIAVPKGNVILDA